MNMRFITTIKQTATYHRSQVMVVINLCNEMMESAYYKLISIVKLNFDIQAVRVEEIFEPIEHSIAHLIYNTCYLTGRDIRGY